MKFSYESQRQSNESQRSPLGSIAGQRRRSHILAHMVLAGLLALFLGPFLWLVATSLKTNDAMFLMPPQWIPNPVTTEHYQKAFTEFPAARYTSNTLIIVFFSTLGTLLSCSTAAYAFSRLRWPDRNLIFGVLLATMMLPAAVTMIPIFVFYSKIGWVDTFLPLIVPSFFGNAFFIFLLRQFFLTIPEDLLEAARLDGASEWRVFWTIILPLSKPALLTVTIFTVLRDWNDFMGPLIYLTSEKNRTLALGLAHLQGVQDTEWGLLMAAALLMTLPALLLFFVAQRFFIEGIAMTGTKA
ncbi:MAG TPA: carbohydrate ABC transporter permease [Planctomycetota bacterium]|jgi:ABC-type glycerol-3-phosphate transport system permease component